MTKINTGTREWSVKSVNCVTGCEHGCRYCYARYRECVRFKRVAPEDWTTMRVRSADVRKKHPKYAGRVMFPTSHDITPSVLGPCLDVIGNLLSAGNEVLIVSKPHLECVMAICERFARHRDDILFRFSIGALDNGVLAAWEPGAPTPQERISCLVQAHFEGFRTSVSAEPLLETPMAWELFAYVEPYVTDTVWFGKLNAIDRRVFDVPAKEIERVRRGQTDEVVLALYKVLKDEPKVRWKDSYREVITRTIPMEAKNG